MIEVAETTCEKVSGKAEARLSSCFAQLQEAHVTLQAVLDRYAERWEQAWNEEADLRAAGDQEVRQSHQDMAKRLEEAVIAQTVHQSPPDLAERLEATTQAYDQRAQDFERSIQKLDEEAGSEARLRQETDNWLLMRLSDLQKEMRMESDMRNTTDLQLQSRLEQYRSLVAQAASVPSPSS